MLRWSGIEKILFKLLDIEGRNIDTWIHPPQNFPRNRSRGYGKKADLQLYDLPLEICR
jgi:hypothetical protein